MTSSKKFLFDTCFEALEPPKPSPVDEPKEVPAVEPEPEEPPAPSYSEEELEAARQEASKSGWEAGHQAARGEDEQALAKALAEITDQLGILHQETKSLAEQGLSNSARLATTLVRRLFPNLDERCGLTEIETLVGDCLEHLHEEPRLVLRVRNDLLERVRQSMEALLPQAGFEGKIVFLGDDTMGGSDVRLEWADGGAERNCERQWEAIDESIARALPTSAPSPAQNGGDPSEAALSPSAEPREITKSEIAADPIADGEDPEDLSITTAPPGPAYEDAPLAGGPS